MRTTAYPTPVVKPDFELRVLGPGFQQSFSGHVSYPSSVELSINPAL